MIPNPTIILGAALGWLLSLGIMGFVANEHGHKAEKIIWEAVIAQQKAEAAQILAKSEKARADKEQEYDILKDQIEKDHAKAQSDIDAAYAANSKLIADNGLRDKAGRGSCGSNRMPANPTPASSASKPPAIGCQLSAKTSQSLLDLAMLADRTAAYAASCHEWVMSLPSKP